MLNLTNYLTKPTVKISLVLLLIVLFVNATIGIFYGISEKLWSHRTTTDINNSLIFFNSLITIFLLTIALWNISLYFLNKK